MCIFLYILGRGIMMLKPNEYEVNSFTTNDIDSIPIESGHVNIDAFFEKPWDDAIKRTITTEDGTISMKDIVFLAGNPTDLVYYARYTNENGELITEQAHVTSEGEPVRYDGDIVHALACSEGTRCLDLVNNGLWEQYKQGTHTAWRKIYDAIPVHLARLRYEDIDINKYYWDISEQALYKFNSDRSLWYYVGYDVTPVDGNPVEVIEEPDSSKYYYNMNGLTTVIMSYNRCSKEWETVRDAYIVNGHPSTEFTDNWLINQDIYYIDSTTNKPYRYDHPWKKMAYKLHGVNGDPRNLGTSLNLINPELYYYDYNNTETPLYLFSVEQMAWLKVGDIIIVEGQDPSYVYQNIDDIDMEKYYYYVPAIGDDDNGILYRFSHTVFLERVSVDDKVYENMFQFYRNMMNVYFDLNNTDRVINKKFICTTGHPINTYIQPESGRIYIDTVSYKFYKATESPLIEVPKPYDLAYIDVDSVDDLDMEGGKIYLNPVSNICYKLVNGLKQQIKAPTPVREIDASTTFESGPVYTEDGKYYMYMPYEEIVQANYALPYEIFFHCRSLD